jgi:NADPH2:quinone reductase
VEKLVAIGKMKSVRLNAYGGPEALRIEEIPTPRPASGEAVVALRAIGVNYIDIYTRSGLNPANLPITLGVEGAGVVSNIGQGVSEVSVGDPVAYTNVMGSYAEFAAVPSSRLVKLPRGMDEKLAAAVMLQGMTAHYLSHDTFPLKKGHSVLIHAGAGGVGLLLIQMAKQLGAYVITTTSTQAKAALTREAGADHVIIYTEEDFENEVKKLTEGKGVDVVYDSVGKTTFDKSLRSLNRRGCLVLFGQSSGPVQPTPPTILSKGSLFLTRPTLDDYTATRQELEHRAGEVLEMVKSGKLKVRIFQTFPLSQAAETHRLLESRQTTGKLLLTP